MKLKNNLSLISILFIIIMVIILVFSFIYLLLGLFGNSEYSSFYFLNEIISCILGILIISLWNRYTIVIRWKNSEEIEKKYDEIRNSVISENSTPEKNTDILELMLANMREINDYYILSKTQAQKSFTLAVVMCIIGIVLMGISIFAAFFQENNVISAIIPAVGAAIVEVIAGTSLIVYKNSLSQLNRYFNSLHSNERFLSIVNIVSKVSPEKQDDMYFEIIKSQIGLVSTDLVENTNEENKAK